LFSNHILFSHQDGSKSNEIEKQEVILSESESELTLQVKRRSLEEKEEEKAKIMARKEHSMDKLNADCLACVLKYLPFREKFRLERVSNMWRMMMFIFVTSLTIKHSTLIVGHERYTNKEDVNLSDSYEYDYPSMQVNINRLRFILSKCKNIERFEISRLDKLKEEFLHLIANCQHLTCLRLNSIPALMKHSNYQFFFERVRNRINSLELLKSFSHEYVVSVLRGLRGCGKVRGESLIFSSPKTSFITRDMFATSKVTSKISFVSFVFSLIIFLLLLMVKELLPF
jgi:hypothetical protein